MLILASQSPTRKTLLENAGLRFSVQPARIDERALESAARKRGETSQERALGLARAKAGDVSARSPGALVIGSDQTLDWPGGEIHKPQSLPDAARQLQALSGSAHQLHSAVSLVKDGQDLFSHVGTARLTLKPWSARRIEQVLALEGDAVLSSVGGYRLEGPSIRLFQSIEGDYFTILGLPLLALLDALETIAPETMDIKGPLL